MLWRKGLTVKFKKSSLFIAVKIVPEQFWFKIFCINSDLNKTNNDSELITPPYQKKREQRSETNHLIINH